MIKDRNDKRLNKTNHVNAHMNTKKKQNTQVKYTSN